ncbi:hypothetical protein B0H63DRAFT_269753 [Podospora didyma]|uniref:DUF1770 domain-containing protein n=1 Tax=Podospora didyma TaxID=330526 RepID=A0AAE0N8Y1_9PEZI|nr:hypothetical protein B0H63DRAFT_269753 [Podospora didyma]
MASSLPLQVAETIQTAHINRDPSAAHDINPSTAASRKEPVVLDNGTAAMSSLDKPQNYEYDDDHHHQDFLDGDGIDEGDNDNDDEDIPFSVLRPRPRKAQLPPIPDLRYEQSYLHSIRNVDRWGKVLWITARDQMMMPFVQGVIYNLGICGWQYWNKNAQLSGSSIGARVRRWWWGVNNWAIPGEKKRG